jgi:hypothetical protein
MLPSLRLVKSILAIYHKQITAVLKNITISSQEDDEYHDNITAHISQSRSRHGLSHDVFPALTFPIIRTWVWW